METRERTVVGCNLRLMEMVNDVLVMLILRRLSLDPMSSYILSLLDSGAHGIVPESRIELLDFGPSQPHRLMREVLLHTGLTRRQEILIVSRRRVTSRCTSRLVELRISRYRVRLDDVDNCMHGDGDDRS